MKSQDEIFALCDQIRETSFSLHRYLRQGHLEKVYENSLAHRLRKASLHVEQQHPLKVFDEDGTVLGDYFADLLVEKELIVELKACKAIASEHVAQLLGYLRACRIEHGLLINFGPQGFKSKSTFYRIQNKSCVFCVFLQLYLFRTGNKTCQILST